jgi:transposase
MSDESAFDFNEENAKSCLCRNSQGSFTAYLNRDAAVKLLWGLHWLSTKLLYGEDISWTAPPLPDSGSSKLGRYNDLIPEEKRAMPGRVHSREFKLTVCRQVHSGEKRPAQICREHTLDQSVLSRWRKEFAERGEENAFLPKQPVEVSPTEALEQRIADLERHCGRLSLENELLKKLAARLPSRSATP